MKRSVLLLVLTILVFRISAQNAWQQVNSGIYGAKASQLAVRANKMAIATSNGVYFSNDTGTLWTPANNGLPGKYIMQLTMSGNRIIININQYGLYFSDNDGNNWTQCATGFSAGVTRLDSRGSLVYATSYTGAGMRFSNDSGNTWVTANNGMTEHHIWCHTFKDSSIYIGTYGGVFKAPLDCSNWIAVDSGLTNQFITGLCADSGILVAVSSLDSVFVSYNNGQYWTKTGVAPLHVSDMTIYKGYIYATSNSFNSKGVWRSSLSNPGTWTELNADLHCYDGSFVKEGNHLYFASGGYGVCLLDEINGTWIAKNTGTKNFSGRVIKFADRIIAATSCGIYLSFDHGDNWNLSSNGMNNRVICDLSIDGTDVYAATAGDGVYVSHDSANSWIPLMNALPHKTLIAVVSSQGHILAQEWAGLLYRSDNSGSTWYTLPIPSIAQGFYKYQNMIYAGTNNGSVIATYNYGSAWTTLYSSIQTISKIIRDSANLFAGASPMLISSDTGISWRTLALGIYSFELLNNFIMIASGTGGIFISDSSSINWIPLNNGFPSPLPRFIFLDLADSHLFGSAQNSDGIWRLDMRIPVGLPEGSSNKDFCIYPNPANDILYINRLHKTGRLEYTIINLSGLIVLEGELETSDVSAIPTAKLPNGIYFLRLKASKDIFTSKFIKLN